MRRRRRTAPTRRCTSRTRSGRSARPRSGGCGGGRGLVALTEQAVELGDGKRTAAQEALELVAAEFLENRELRRVLDALGDDFQLEAVGEGDDRLHDQRIVAAVREVADERAVDLERV